MTTKNGHFLLFNRLLLFFMVFLDSIQKYLIENHS